MSIRDRSLVIAQHTDSSKMYPQEVFYQKVRASGSTDSTTNFNIKTPGTGWLLCNEIWLSYKMRITCDNNLLRQQVFEANGNNWPTSAIKFFPRQNSALSRCMSSITVQINQASVTDRPADTIDAQDRLWLSQDESESCSSPGAGFFDGPKQLKPITRDSVPELFLNTDGTGAFNSAQAEANVISAGGNAGGTAKYFKYRGIGPRATTSAAVANDNHGSFTFGGCEVEYNRGAQCRWEKVLEEAKTNEVDGDGNVVAEAAGGSFGKAGGTSFEITFHERVPSSLFYQYASRDKLGLIPHVQSMSILIQYVGDIRNKWMQIAQGFKGADNAGAETNAAALIRVYASALTGQQAGTAPNPAQVVTNFKLSLTGSADENEVDLHLKWVLPPASVQIPSSVPVKAPAVLVHSKTISGNKQHGQSSTETFDVEFPWVPTQLLIYAKVPVAGAWSAHITAGAVPDNEYLGPLDQTEMFAEIASIDITTDGETGKLMAMNSAQLYAAWKRNGHKGDMKRFPYDEWRRNYCVAALSPGDYGARKPPGSLGRFLLSVKPQLKYWNPNHSKAVSAMTTVGGTTAKFRYYTGYAKRYDLYVVGINNAAYVEMAPGGFARIGYRSAALAPEAQGSALTGGGGFTIGGLPGLSGGLVSAGW